MHIMLTLTAIDVDLVDGLRVKKPVIWPFLDFNVAFVKISFSRVQKHVNAHKFHIGQNFLGPS